MDSFDKQGLDEDAFGDKGLSSLRTFDAFPKTKPTYTSTTARGGQWTLAIIILCTCLTFNELRAWWSGIETHHFSVERGVGHELQLNLDIVVGMPCRDLHVNVQDAAMDRIMAGDLLTKEDTNFALWTGNPRKRRRRNYQGLHEDDEERKKAQEEDTHVGHVLGHMRENPSKKFSKTLRLHGAPVDSCRIYGSLEGNKVQGDFHITARGHGYMEFGGQQHLEHGTFNFSHHINELSFGPHYPNLLNPLDKTSDTAEVHFMRYQYYLSIVPTIFTKRRVSTKSGSFDPAALPQPPTLDMTPNTKKDKDGIVRHVPNPKAGHDSKSIFTNQYAATSQSREVPTNTVPGIFFKYDIEPILLIVSERRNSLLGLLVRLVNVISGVLVGGGWMFQLTEWGYEVWGRRRGRSNTGLGVINGNINGDLDHKS
ncbi:hypothetical protein LTR10_018163 [Elasticomyces elasticus]|uniref:Endoplasmic reticulum-Golgi intermediate compartment protein n=1 Tax=Exophiala sideris TaxID=1016849 RepID=A0ABR0J313_9EURO|nr:hypothetical protein LTR10_018163 [Elasticomyces elasticus]KAK5024957.1 hypothetical protein LTS07_008335 [Exophiala sideris]KAK5031454.1 hypothetical protein LTR13_007782 [Exophiala sideris]KAK5054995.1 hypothetical protein LTR69_008563 [Exophiala sideris]KAK5179876.1 hypothetical protein LTR44_007692 [Eurotiomycetes sp. CCFEE 6388]